MTNNILNELFFEIPNFISDSDFGHQDVLIKSSHHDVITDNSTLSRGFPEDDRPGMTSQWRNGPQLYLGLLDQGGGCGHPGY